MDAPRQFSQRQKRALYLAADGKCENCGTELEDGFHADHVLPHSMGGATKIENGQALCAQCNLKKSDNLTDMRFNSDVFGPAPHAAPLDWQEDAIMEFNSTSGNFLCDATPGSGKTALAAYLFRHRFGDLWDQIIVITNSQARREGWQEDLQRFGVQTMEDWAGRDSNPTIKDYHGCVSTYHILPTGKLDLKAISQRERTLVVFDEIHHLGDEQAWAEAATFAFNHRNAHTIGLTGTPFRSDDKQIPFVDYSYQDGVLKSDGDVGYTYGDALRDEVLRPVNFIKYDGEMVWRGSDGNRHEATFEDDVAERLKGERLRTAVNEKGYLFEQIVEANEKLSQIREGFPHAGGFIVARNQNHAEKIAKWMQADSRFGTPAVIVSDDDRATSSIKQFKESNRRWAIAVEKISEGVNIKRLRVGVYASNKTAPLFLHQVVGRVLRGSGGQAFFWFPDDPRIVDVLEEIEEMRDHVIEDSEDWASEDGSRSGAFSEYESAKATIGEGSALGPLLNEIPYMSREQVAKLPETVKDTYIEYCLNGNAPAPSSQSRGDGAPKQNQYKREVELRSELIPEKVNKAAKIGHHELYVQGGEKRGIAIAKTHKKANREVGFKNQDEATVEQLERKLEVLQNWIAQSHA
jgi:superfamily II DNA or RNA helicase